MNNIEFIVARELAKHVPALDSLLVFVAVFVKCALLAVETINMVAFV